MGKICENCDWKDGDFCPHMLDCKNYSEFTPKQKTGHWLKSEIKNATHCVCSECGDYWDITGDLFAFCPCCGAKMDEEAADGSISRESNISNH